MAVSNVARSWYCPTFCNYSLATEETSVFTDTLRIKHIPESTSESTM